METSTLQFIIPAVIANAIRALSVPVGEVVKVIKTELAFLPKTGTTAKLGQIQWSSKSIRVKNTVGDDYEQILNPESQVGPGIVFAAWCQRQESLSKKYGWQQPFGFPPNMVRWLETLKSTKAESVSEATDKTQDKKPTKK